MSGWKRAFLRVCHAGVQQHVFASVLSDSGFPFYLSMVIVSLSSIYCVPEIYSFNPAPVHIILHTPISFQQFIFVEFEKFSSDRKMRLGRDWPRITQRCSVKLLILFYTLNITCTESHFTVF